MGDTLKVTDDILTGYANGPVAELYHRFNGDSTVDTDGAALIQLLNEYANGSTPGKDSLGNYTMLMGGTSVEAKAMQDKFKAYAGNIVAQFTALKNDMTTLSTAISNAKTTLNNAEEDALTAAQMFEILGGSPLTPPPKP
ncbi:hypothetical protein OG500_11855 [Kitasatospora sp. NBC_01250]|uniref:hypothetical protein n=1 Tax=unclassified Kitasatospora TaxID=2633591 RepID=UPI002E105047|nr:MULTISPECIES: hypothetical protein [unclassified Kitasatospora]WSJ66826.1 hypothetical protein OG294_12295 [Kitasatospora sp. NBC_01302]